MASLIHEPDRPRKPWRVSWVERGRRHTRRFAQKAEARRFRSEVEAGKQVTLTERTTIHEWILRWIRTRGPEWEPRTRHDRAAYADRFIIPLLGKRRLGELRRPDVREFRATIRAQGASVYTANRVIEVLSAALGEAVEDDLIAANPVRGMRRLPRTGVKRRLPASVGEVEAIRLAMPISRDRAMVCLMAYAGARPSELGTLRWSDVLAGTLTIQSGLASDGREKDTKTGSVRSVPIIPALREDLDALERGTGLVTGVALNHRNWTKRVWHPARDAAGTLVVPYSLRHTFASLLIAEGMNAWQVARLMGHSNPQQVIQTYGHLFAEAEVAAPVPMAEAARAARHRASSMSRTRDVAES